MSRWRKRLTSIKYRIKGQENEVGAIVMEATLSLTFFTFFIVTFMSLIGLCTAQAKIGIALNESAVELSQYTYVYNLTGLNELQQTNYDAASGTREDISTVTTGLSETVSSMQALVQGVTEEDLELEQLGEQLDSTVNTAQEHLGNAREVVNHVKGNPKNWVLGLVRTAGNEGYEVLKGQAGHGLVKALMKKHLEGYGKGTADKYLRDLGVVNGMDGLNLRRSSILTNGSQNITLVCEYEVEALNFFNQSLSFKFSQMAKTMAWSAKPFEPGTPEGMEPAAEETTETDETEETLETAETEETEETIIAESTTRDVMVAKYGEGAVREVEMAYDNTEEWTDEEWEYYIGLYAGSDASGNKTGADLEDYLMSDAKYGESAGEAIKKAKKDNDTSNWELRDWEEYIEIYQNPNTKKSDAIRIIPYRDRQRLGNWTHKPDDDNYLDYKEVYDNPKYFRQDTGDVRWPPNDGYQKGTRQDKVIEKDTVFLRYGNEQGNYLGNATDSFEKRSLAPYSKNAEKHYYKLNKDYTVETGKVAPWFGSEGGGEQFVFYKENGQKYSIEELIKEDILVEVSEP